MRLKDAKLHHPPRKTTSPKAKHITARRRAKRHAGVEMSDKSARPVGVIYGNRVLQPPERGISSRQYALKH